VQVLETCLRSLSAWFKLEIMAIRQFV
jgi:hypothetical protein